ncbi:cytidyltransferase-like domain-containing protein [Anaerosphaera aminiphila DSM 21120]|uniref:tRNA(Met) cytidine acetate ligase n=1 Tax=Anaerosphaera aminiphila DSM 21120 TaxID=1120995 RepID=A0A1M5P2S8_9FIRM|nr:nucleotidyltransferase family protein [Anaerosphaera aminiphila]SHG96126.1 cytidyltransferase-like domain-containing protein [Anaerosphaera aminiphila DSM 21120]
MKIAAIVAEYNPFHNGHKYQIDKIKELGYSVIVIMSSSFTQRGQPAIINKFDRSEIAIKNGVDLVIELPAIYSTSNAEIFSKGSIFILNSLGIVDNLFFGSEDELSSLIEIVQLIDNKKDTVDEAIKAELKKGSSFLRARESAYSFLNTKQLSILRRPNNILAIEYLKSLKSFKSTINPISIQRKNVEHNSDITRGTFSSASNIREMLIGGNIEECKKFIPINSYDNLKELHYNELNNYFNIFKYMILKNDIDYSNYFDYENGLENRFFKFIESNNISEFINLVSSKRYTNSRISRLITQILLGIEKSLIADSFTLPYIRILASNETGFKIIREIKKENLVIDKFSNINSLPDNDIRKKIALKESFVTNIYNLNQNKNYNEDYFKNLLIFK